MHSTLVDWRRGVVTVAMAVGSVALGIPGAWAEERSDAAPRVVPVSAGAFGMSYGDWSAAWWQYVLSTANSSNPVLDASGTHCAVGQSSGPVFFLAGAPSADPVSRTCTVPAGKTLIIPIVVAECSTVEAPPFFGGNGQALRTCAAALADGIDASSLWVAIDKRRLKDPAAYRVQSPVFDFVMPSADNFLGLAGVTTGSALSDGYWVIVQPLSPGQHKIHFKGSVTSGPAAGFAQDVNYQLTVLP